MRKHKTFYLILIAFLILLSAFSVVQAIPEYTGETGITCAGCHVEPRGGGTLTDFGRDWMIEQGGVLPEDKAEEPIEEIGVELPQWLIAIISFFGVLSAIALLHILELGT